MASLAGRVALVTGVGRSRGIGAAVARAFADAGASIYTTWWSPYDTTRPWRGDPRDPQLVLEDLRARGAAAEGCELDLSEPDAAARLFERAEEALGPVDVLVNNAAYSAAGGIDELAAESLDAHFAVNVRAMALLCAELSRRFARRAAEREGRGRIVNLTSGQGAGPMPDELAYAASKGAVDAFTVSLSAALAPRGITVNAVDPGPTDTGWMTPELRRAIEDRSPMRRTGTPDDVARLVLFLCSEEGGWITGQVLRSRGGL